MRRRPVIRANPTGRTLHGVTGENRWLSEAGDRSRTYDQRWEELAAAGENVHGEADFMESLYPRSVLDAGCGTGRVAIELARRGIDVVGVDLDASMLDVARSKAPRLQWVHADLADVDLGRTFDVVVMAGNVMIFLAPGTEGAVVANLARHLGPGGRLVAGFSVQPGRLDLPVRGREPGRQPLQAERRRVHRVGAHRVVSQLDEGTHGCGEGRPRTGVRPHARDRRPQ
jgi:SAM-dependent methyltransferase